MTSDREERNILNAIAASRKEVGILPKGSCHWCDEPTAVGVLYCTVECREDHERVTSLRKRAGR